jgi:hypothetical protein
VGLKFLAHDFLSLSKTTKKRSAVGLTGAISDLEKYA